MSDDTAISTTARLLAVRSPMHASLSPDGTRLLLTTGEVPLGEIEEVLRATVIDVAIGDEGPVSTMGAGDHSAVWAPDGVGLAWCTQLADGTAAIAVADALDGVPRVLAGSHRTTGTPSWSPDGTTIAVAARRGTVVDRTRPYRWTRPIAAFDGTGPLEDPPQILLLDVGTGEGRWLTDDDWRWSSPCWSPDGSRLAATTSIDPEGHRTGSHLRIVMLDGTEVPHEVPAGRSATPAWLPDCRLAVLVAEPRTGRLGGAAALFVVDGAATRRIDRPHLFGDVYGDNPAILPEMYDNVLQSDGTGYLVARVGSRGTMGVIRLHPDEPDEVGVVADGQRCCTPVGAVDGTVVFTTQSAEHLPELAVVDAQGERLLTRFADGVTTAAVRRFTVTSSAGAPTVGTEPEGWPLDGWLLTPRDAAGPLPTVLMIHGGPQFTFGESFHIDAQALTAAGFAVLFTNPRGSTGYGDEFAFAVHGDWADGPTRDVLQVIDHAVAQGWIDGNRLGVTGNSYGGYLSAWLASTTRRFRAAVIENPVTDLAAMYGTSDIGATFFPQHFGGAPHEVPDLYRTQSPITHAHRCTTPCLFLVGADDRRCPPSQAWAMHRVLHVVGTPSEVLVLPDSSHEGSTYGPPLGRLTADEALAEWMTRWL
jgi:dipeptidyl aminopeptidase/acylaminoacyl peptidase